MSWFMFASEGQALEKYPFLSRYLRSVGTLNFTAVRPKLTSIFLELKDTRGDRGDGKFL